MDEIRVRPGNVTEATPRRVGVLRDFNFRGSAVGRGLLVADFEALEDQGPWSVAVTIESGMTAGDLSAQLRSMADEIDTQQFGAGGD